MKTTVLVLAGILAISVGMSQSTANDFPANFRAHLSGDQEVPERLTNATGQALFRLSSDGTELKYRLIVANIDNVFGAHIHLGPQGSNGPVAVFLFGSVPPGGGRIDGVLAEGTITSGDLVGPLAGQDLSVLLASMETGGTYVNVHTSDGIPPNNSGPGDFASGEVRGQIAGK